MSIRQLKNATQIPTDTLEDWGTPKTIGEPKCHLNGIQLVENDDGSEGGIWECTPGTWTRQVMDAEISTFVKGRAQFHPEDGETIDIRAGDTVYFDENSKGIWEVKETVRKAYLTFKRG